jgi:hypothetical protein
MNEFVGRKRKTEDLPEGLIERAVRKKLHPKPLVGE